MELRPTSDGRRRRLFWGGLVAGVATGAAVQVAGSWLGEWPAFSGRFIGPDPHMRILRILECAGGGCPGGIFPRSNAPFGEVLHWPHLLDWLILVLATPFRPWLSEAEAVANGAYLVGPVLQVGAVAAVLLAARSLLDRSAWAFAGVVLSTQLWVSWAFAPSRPDHHGLQALLFLLAVASAIQLVAGPPTRWAEARLGLAVGGALWVSVEGLVTVTLPLGVLAARWVSEGGRDWSRANARVWGWASLTLVGALVVDGPEAGALAVVYDRVSIPYTTMMMAGAGVWLVLVRLGEGSSITQRLVAACGGLAIATVGVAWLYPGLLRGPLADVDPRIVPIWLDQVAEYVPLLEQGPRGASIPALAPLAVALPGALLAGRRAPAEQSWGWYFVSASLLWFAVLGAVHGSRWTYYLHQLVPLPLCWILDVVLRRSRDLRVPLARATVQVVAVVALALGPLLGVAAAAARLPSGFLDQADPGSRCSADEFVTSLPESIITERGAIILAPLFWGPEIMYHTNLDVVATPYHRNHAGILDSRDIMMSADDGELIRRLQRRGVRYVAACRLDPWSPLLTELDGGSLFTRLMEDDPPAFLTEVPLRPEGAARYGLWSVDLLPGDADGTL